MKTIILANGEIPVHKNAIEILNNGDKIVCCDGAIQNLKSLGYSPNIIIGDLDSISEKDKIEYQNILFEDKNEEVNDLQKAINYCISNNWNNIYILGGFGLREDHAIANLSIMLNYAKICFEKDTPLNIQMITNTGTFIPFFDTTIFKSYKGQAVSIFSFTKESKLTFIGLKYPVKERVFHYFWEGSLNEALTDQFTIECSRGEFIIFQTF